MTDEPEPLDPKEASRWIASQMRAREKSATGRREPDPEPLDPAEASRLIAERIRARGGTAVRLPVAPDEEVVLARPITRENLLGLLTAGAGATLRSVTAEEGTVRAEPISLAEFEFLLAGRAARRA
ncbi:MAG: hypothetical protein L0216_16000 [Planctomycetales bacterium]|nr:hypothetical protein [Planctomycetales bacterium]